MVTEDYLAKLIGVEQARCAAIARKVAKQCEAYGGKEADSWKVCAELIAEMIEGTFVKGKPRG